MAKSLRSKSKRAFRRAKRQDPTSDYHIAHKNRIVRAANRMALGDKAKVEVTARLGRFSHVANLTGKRLVSTIDAELQRGTPVVASDDGTHGLDKGVMAEGNVTTIARAHKQDVMSGSDGEAEEETESIHMDLEGEVDPSAISTSAPRQNRRETWREARGCKRIFAKRTKANKTTFSGHKKFAPAHGRSKSAVLQRR